VSATRPPGSQRSARPSSEHPFEDEVFVDPTCEIVKAVIPMFGTGDVLLRIAEDDGTRWIEIRIREDGCREVWDKSALFRSQANALEWASRVDSTITG
jgi:hypothetical protein